MQRKIKSVTVKFDEETLNQLNQLKEVKPYKGNLTLCLEVLIDNEYQKIFNNNKMVNESK